MPHAFAHMWLASVETSLFFVGAVSAWYLLKGRHPAFFLKTFRLAVAGALVVAPLQILAGHESGLSVAEHQPAKLAAIEGLWETSPAGETSPWAALAWPDKAAQENRWELAIPGILGLIVAGDMDAKVQGLEEWSPQDQPDALPALFYGFRLMVAIGVYLLAVALFSAWLWMRGRLQADDIGRHRWLLKGWILGAPLAYVATEAGWFVREVGRQPWAVYGEIRTEHAVSNLTAGTVLSSAAAFSLIYLLLLGAALHYGARLIRRGPDLTLDAPQPPGWATEAPADRRPDRRPQD